MIYESMKYKSKIKIRKKDKNIKKRDYHSSL